MEDKVKTYLFWIDFFGADEQKINAIVEKAAFDDEITAEEYCAVYAHAIEILQM